MRERTRLRIQYGGRQMRRVNKVLFLRILPLSCRYYLCDAIMLIKLSMVWPCVTGITTLEVAIVIVNFARDAIVAVRLWANPDCRAVVSNKTDMGYLFQCYLVPCDIPLLSACLLRWNELMTFYHPTPWTHGVIITSLLRQNDVILTQLRHNDVVLT